MLISLITFFFLTSWLFPLLSSVPEILPFKIQGILFSLLLFCWLYVLDIYNILFMIQSSSRQALMNRSVPFTIRVPDTQILPSTVSQWEGHKSTTTSVRNIAIKVCTGCHTILLSEVIIPGLADAEIWRERGHSSWYLKRAWLKFGRWKMREKALNAEGHGQVF